MLQDILSVYYEQRLNNQTCWITYIIQCMTMTRVTTTCIIQSIDWCFTARQHKIGQFVPIYQGGLLAQAFEDQLFKVFWLH